MSVSGRLFLTLDTMALFVSHTVTLETYHVIVFPWSPLDFLHSMVQWFLKPQMLRAIRWAWNPETGLRAMPRLQQAYRLGLRHTVWLIFRSPTKVRIAVCLYSDCSPNSHNVSYLPCMRTVICSVRTMQPKNGPTRPVAGAYKVKLCYRWLKDSKSKF